MSYRVLTFLGLAIIGTAVAILATSNDYKGIIDSFAIIASVISFGITLIAWFREKQ